MDHLDYYSVLGIEKHAAQHEIKAAYRKLALQYHPDRNGGDHGAAEKMKAINEAYAVLSNEEKRREYDLLQKQFGSSAHNRFRQSYTEQDIFRGSDINRMFEEMARSFGLRGFDEIFKEAYGNGYRTFEFSNPHFSGKGYVFTSGFGQSSVNSVKLPPLNGIVKILRYTLKKACGIELPERGKDLTDTIGLNPHHVLEGGSFEYTMKKRDKKLMIKIPPGISDGQKIRIAGMGEAGTGGAESGDLFLKVHIKKPVLGEIKDFLTNIIK